MEFRLFGAVEAHIGGRPVDLGPARQRCVLVALLIDANCVVPIDQLMSRVWGEASDHRATLYSYLSRLRKALADAEEAEIVRVSGGYTLTVDPMVVDLWRFRHLVELARLSQDAEDAAEWFEQALSLRRGEAFGCLDTAWLSELRGQVDAELRATRLRRNELMLRLGRHMDLIADLTADVAAQPLDEQLVSQLMLALYRAGRRAEALWVYHRTRKALADELGIDPGPELTELHRRALADAVDVAPGVANGRRPGSTQFPADVVDFTDRDKCSPGCVPSWTERRILPRQRPLR
ncbi:AfsR/SARP family transcriptional regulator [Amycolatopsis vastitatis]|uniref:AfsR/SARP family transcriptional regulator n=1 Tax=Amycolatopsis vastitatis TaxID=1905142 RepID=UPI00130458F3|nr:AfsR/SARP family transcriptional regulator [Amycolatopsis vastitatis]